MQRKKRKEKIINYIEKLYPNKLNTGKEINLEGFGIHFGNLAGNNPLFADVAKQVETHNSFSLKDLKESRPKLLADEMDQYYTPNFFTGTGYSKRNTNSVMWLNSLFVDIDGIKGVTDYREGLYKLYKACEKAGIPLPDIVLHTSTNPTVHLQALWLIDPIYIKDKFNQDKNNKNKEWWKSANFALNYVLGQADRDLKIDSGVASDLARYLRLPYTFNQKTGEMVKIIADRITDKRHLLESNWVENIIKDYFTRDYQYKNLYNKIDDIDILQHPQYKAILQGVPKDYRNFAHYALLKAYEVSGYSKEETFEKLLEFNKRCKPQEKISQIKSVMCGYGDGKAIDINIIAELATISFGEGEFNLDPALLRLYNIMNGTLQRKYKTSYNDNKGLVERVIPLLRGYAKAGNRYLPNLKELAEIFSVKYNSLKKHFKTIKTELKKNNLFINYDYKENKYKLLTYFELIQYAYKKKEETGEKYVNFWNKVIHNPLYQTHNIVLYGSLCSQPDFIMSLIQYINLHKRGSPKLE